MRGVTGLLLGICCLSLIACGGSSKKKSFHLADEGLSNIHPYVNDAPYGATLKQCATAAAGQSCTLDRLPALGMETAAPTVEDIMARTLVSHPWMGERFEEILNEMPQDLLLLFRSLTAVVIDDDIRPSYYNPRTATIYLDPDYIWLTEEERSVINTKEDFRGEYIRQMAYRPVWRYVNGPFGSQGPERSFDGIVVDMAQLLFHELAHATDIFPPASFATVDRSRKVESVTESLYDSFPSTRLLFEYPLQSDVMFDLAGILYGGETATPAYRVITAAQVGGYFAADGANDDYNYSSQYEDVAMLFEEAMMKLHFGMDRDVGFTNAADSYYCDDYILGWGMRNRLGVEQIKIRAEWVVQQLLPGRDYSLWFDNFPQARQLQTNVSWCDSGVVLQLNEKNFSSRSHTDGRLIDPRNLRPSGALQHGL